MIETGAAAARLIVAAGVIAGLLAASSSVQAREKRGPISPRVELEEEVYTYKPADNGAGPTWCFGTSALVRIGERVFASGIETVPDRKPLNNCVALLFERGKVGWKLVHRDTGFTREPCPLVGFPDGRLFQSVNPNDAKPDEYDGPAHPQILQFDATDAGKPLAVIIPDWGRELEFHGHTYRSFVADAPRKELLLMYNTGYDCAHWTFRDAKGRWAAHGDLAFPFEPGYTKPQPVRLCYPVVTMRSRAVHFLGPGDIVEPNSEWRKFKKELTGAEWDYVFRRLFYAWTPDITSKPFSKWVEIANREKTAGSTLACDIYLARDGAVHILWMETSLDTRLRQKFFPDAKLTTELRYAVLRDGKVISNRALVAWEEGKPDPTPSWGRFQVTPDGRLFVFYSATATQPDGTRALENRIMEIRADGTLGEPVKVDLKHPLTGNFFTATPRGGSRPSDVIDLYGECEGKPQTLCYARVRLR